MNPSGKVMLNYGAMSGLCSFIFFLLLHFMGFNPLGQASLFGSWIPVIFICLATGYYRDRIMTGFINYGQAFRIGFLTASSGAFMFSLLIYIYGTAINHDMVDIYKNGILDDLEKTRSIISDSMYETSIENIENTSMFSIAYSAFFSKTFGGLLISLITAGFYRRNQIFHEQE